MSILAAMMAYPNFTKEKPMDEQIASLERLGGHRSLRTFFIDHFGQGAARSIEAARAVEHDWDINFS